MGRPSRAYKASLQEPTKEHYRQLLLACVTAILNDQAEVILAVSHLTKFPADFPKGLIVATQHPIVYRRIKANRLIHWLNNNGHTEVTMEDLRVQQRKVTLLEKELIDGLLQEED